MSDREEGCEEVVRQNNLLRDELALLRPVVEAARRVRVAQRHHKNTRGGPNVLLPALADLDLALAALDGER